VTSWPRKSRATWNKRELAAETRYRAARLAEAPTINQDTADMAR
jgi:hypothetical protein